ncbi:MAG: hypothetical protein IBX41_02405 [Methanophagales archaeon]|nr:hypothetical protein [Methanophagales archaeon]
MTFKDEKIYNGMKELVKKSLAILDRSGFEFEDFNIDVDLRNIPPISFLLNDKISRQIYSKIEEIEKTEEYAYACDLVNKIPTSQSDFKLKKLDDIQFTIEYTYDENEFRNLEDVDEWTYSAYQNATAFCEKKFIEIVALLRLFKDGNFHNPLENFQVPFWGVVPKGIHFNLCDMEIRGDAIVWRGRRLKASKSFIENH